MKQKKTWQSYMSPTILARWHRESKNCPQEKFNNSRVIYGFCPISPKLGRECPLNSDHLLNSKSLITPEMNTTNPSPSKSKLSKSSFAIQ